MMQKVCGNSCKELGQLYMEEYFNFYHFYSNVGCTIKLPVREHNAKF